MSSLLYTDMSAAAQAAFAGLDTAARQREVGRCVADLPGGFTRKLVNGRAYWYYQAKSPDGAPIQTYVGPDDAATRVLIDAHKSGTHAQADKNMLRAARAAVELGCVQVPIKHGRVISRLSDHGFFRAGGILVGTHAFMAYQNLLGVTWVANAMTLDLDFAHAGRNVSIALQPEIKIDTRRAIESLAMGFIPIQSQTTYQKAGEPDFDIDFLTSVGRTGDAPVHVESLNVTLQPLKFMELSMEDPLTTTLLWRNGPVVVNLPRPQRYAVHKLLVFGERPQNMRTKASKDLAQAAALLDYLLEIDQDLIQEAWQDAMSRGPGWQSRLKQGLNALCRQYAPLNLRERLGAHAV